MPVVGNGAEATETRLVGPFNGVHTRDGIALVIEVGGAQGVSVRADANYLDLSADEDILATEVLDGALDVFARVDIDPAIPPVVTIGVSSLDFVSASGEDGSASVTGVGAERFGVAASFGSTVVVSGTCARLSAIASDGATLDASSLECVDARIEASGGSSAFAFVTRSLVVHASGQSRVHVSGAPTDVDNTLTNDAVLELE